MTKLIQLFKEPKAHAIAQRELEESQRRLLEAQSAEEYARAMKEYHQNRIARLTEYLKEAA